MRKIILELEPGKISRFFPEDYFEKIEYGEAKAILRLDFEKGVKIVIADIKMKEGFTLKDLSLPEGSAILDVLKEENNKYTCLVKVIYKKKLMKIFKLFNFDVIYTIPAFVSEEKIVFSFISDNDNLKKLLKVINIFGVVKNIYFQKVNLPEYDILSSLTEKQRKVLITAKKNGYYDIPRKVTAEELSKKLGISKATTVEHLRKAEKRMVSFILAGY
ncbi:helix-turn-helix domain-containing protein [Thermococci archaeon]|nr:MAG: helix-turn-helix domain-containing protein [Thermococci archaeon]